MGFGWGFCDFCGFIVGELVSDRGKFEGFRLARCSWGGIEVFGEELVFFLVMWVNFRKWIFRFLLSFWMIVVSFRFYVRFRVRIIRLSFFLFFDF